MEGFNPPGDLDIDKLIRLSQEYEARSQELQERMASLEGYAESERGMVKVTCTVNGGVSDLEITPRAMRLPAAELAEVIKELIREAGEDLQARTNELMAELFGEENSPDALQRRVEAAGHAMDNAAAAFERAVDDTAGELERIQKRLGL
ncbi:YbaB/EbfC family nucleoid-associated protein [Actinoallomurus spadix]|uniref:YbaB/EbfC family nucleoid-associated protein n=1 Tax=Actinoallomurus spadix TaxID=79912 RepID=UPI00209205DB|nr:YbaB/EbfC family nucleoid-associated protein [Actinoallomurus spadix]MCO5985089.1 YbaB/EbfC family nucleoid-associated protein [Actinoallomurus spadix]